jgi:hypothetical protein
MSYQWPIWSFVNPDLKMSDMKAHMATRLRLSPTSFYCTVFAAATHYALSRVGKQAPPTNLMLRLRYKDLALQTLIADVQQGEQLPDELYHAIFALASYSSAEIIPPMTHRDNQNPLAIAYDMDVYSRVAPELAHFRALCAVLRQRGGLTGIKRPGFAVVVSL